MCVSTEVEHLKVAHPEKLDPDYNVIVRDPNKHDAQKHYKVYAADNTGVNEDLQDPVAAKEWPGYSNSGEHQGPRSFSTMRQRREYMARYGFEEN